MSVFQLLQGGPKGLSGMGKIVPNVSAAVADIESGSSLAVGGFGLCGVPFALIDALLDQGARELSLVSNNCGTDGKGLGVLLEHKRVKRVIASYVGENKEFAQQYLRGELEVELVPQGTLAERLRAGGAGIAAVFTPAGLSTPVALGGLPWRYSADGTVAVQSAPKEVREFHGRQYVLEEGIVCDFAFVHAAKADQLGNLIFHAAARNFNPLCAMAARVTIVEAEQVVPVGQIHPDDVHLPGIFVKRVVAVPEARKPVEKLTLSGAGSIPRGDAAMEPQCGAANGNGEG